ncbi:hypothetical protein GCM10028805_22950 [Spirosoma harenae]
MKALTMANQLLPKGLFSRGGILFILAVFASGCVDLDDTLLRGTIDVIVVDGGVTNLAEPQFIRLNRSKSDPLTGRFGSRPITKATVEVIVDSSQAIPCHETVDGTYQLPSDFKGQIGHAYQLRFTLTDGTRYISNQQILFPVSPIESVSARFNSRSLYPPLSGFYTAGHDMFITFKDDPQTCNYYRWEWNLWEKQEWCRSCYLGVYSIYGVTAMLIYNGYPAGNIYIYTSDNKTLLEDCYYELTPPPYSLRSPVPEYRYDYTCRTQCWEIIHSSAINIFEDQYSNGGLLSGIKVASIPFYDHAPGLVEIRQSSLTPDAYRYTKLFQQQTQNSGGLADTPPTALIGNIRNEVNQQEAVVGYFTASAVATIRYWLDRKDASGVSLGGTDPAGYSSLPGAELYYALNRRQPTPEPSFPEAPQLYLFNSPPRPPTAICVESETRTPYKPAGWRD